MQPRRAGSGSWRCMPACTSLRSGPARWSGCAAKTAICQRPDGDASPGRSPGPRSTAAGPTPSRRMVSAGSSTGAPTSPAAFPYPPELVAILRTRHRHTPCRARRPGVRQRPGPACRLHRHQRRLGHGAQPLLNHRRKSRGSSYAPALHAYRMLTCPFPGEHRSVAPSRRSHRPLSRQTETRSERPGLTCEYMGGRSRVRTWVGLADGFTDISQTCPGLRLCQSISDFTGYSPPPPTRREVLGARAR